MFISKTSSNSSGGTCFGRHNAFLLQKIFGARDGIAQRTKGVVQHRSHFKRLLLLVCTSPAETVRMPLAAALVKVLLEFFRIERELRLEPQRIVELHQAEKDVPQPQLFLAFGFSNTKPDWISESFQSSVMPSRNTRLLGSMKTFTSSKLRI